MSAIVEVRGLERRFGRRKALDGVDLDVCAGEIVGLVGPNGSGKTTLLKTLGGFLKPSAGAARVFGIVPFADQARVMERARFAFAPPALFESLTPREHLRHLCAIRSGSMAAVSAREIDEALELVDLTGRADDRVRTFSFGMRQRLVLAQALLPRPELLVLDEPTDGLDPLGILELRGLLGRLRAEHGIAILLSSHLLVEVEQLVDHMLVLTEGTSLFHGPPAELFDGMRRTRVVVSDRERALGLFAERGIAATSVDGELELPHRALSLEEATALLRAGGVQLEGFRDHRPTLEEALLERLAAR